jgi:hypothetical protein
MLKKHYCNFNTKQQRKNGPSPYIAPTYGAKQQMTSIDDSPLLSKDDKKLLQQVCGKFLYYTRTIDDTMMHSLNALATRVSNGTNKTKSTMKHFLDYCHTNPDAIKLYRACEMILQNHSNAAYLVEPEACSRAGGFFFLGNQDGKLINGSMLIIAKIITNVVSSASEAEIAALFINARAALPLRVALEEMGHRQPATKLITDNSTADGILNGKIKQNQSKGIDMQYYWLRDRVKQGQFIVQWEPVTVVEAYAIDTGLRSSKLMPSIFLVVNLVLMLPGSFYLKNLNITIKTSTLDYNGDRYLSSITNCVIFRL